MKSKTPDTVTGGDASEILQLDNHFPHKLSVAAQRLSRVLARRYADSHGLSLAELDVLAAVGQHGTLSPTSVGQLTTMDKVKVSRASASLVRRGLLRQTRDPNDGRGRLLRLTRKGLTTHNGVVPLAKAFEAALEQHFPRGEWAALNRALSRLNEYLVENYGDEER